MKFVQRRRLTRQKLMSNLFVSFAQSLTIRRLLFDHLILILYNCNARIERSVNMSSVQNLITSRILVSFKFLNEPRPFQATERLRLFLEAVKDISIKDETVTCRMQSCVGCQNCVIACSYHHKRVFSRAVSSLDVKRLEGTNFEAALPRINNSHIACDRCVGLREPVCVKYCPSIAKAELANFLREAWRVLDLV